MADPKKTDQTPPARPTRDTQVPDTNRERVKKHDEPRPLRESTVTDTHKPPPPPPEKE